MDESALLRVYRQHERELLGFLGRRLGSPVKAADLAQDLYVKLLHSQDPPALRDSRAYLFSMAANMATDHLRVERRRREILEEAGELVLPPAAERTPEEQVMARAELDLLRGVVAGFSPRRRQVFYLSRFQGRTQAEIAASLGVGLSTVYKELKGARAELLEARRRFQEGRGGPEGQEDG